MRSSSTTVFGVGTAEPTGNMAKSASSVRLIVTPSSVAATARPGEALPVIIVATDFAMSLAIFAERASVAAAIVLAAPASAWSRFAATASALPGFSAPAGGSALSVLATTGSSVRAAGTSAAALSGWAGVTIFAGGAADLSDRASAAASVPPGPAAASGLPDGGTVRIVRVAPGWLALALGSGTICQ